MKAGCGGDRRGGGDKRGWVVNRRGHPHPLTISLSPWSNSLSINSQQENILKDEGNHKLHVLLMLEPSPKLRAKKIKKIV